MTTTHRTANDYNTGWQNGKVLADLYLANATVRQLRNEIERLRAPQVQANRRAMTEYDLGLSDGYLTALLNCLHGSTA